MTSAQAVDTIARVKAKHADELAQKDAALDQANMAMTALDADNKRLNQEVADLKAAQQTANDTVPATVEAALNAMLS